MSEPKPNYHNPSEQNQTVEQSNAEMANALSALERRVEVLEVKLTQLTNIKPKG